MAVGDDADNVRVARDGRIWVSFGGDGPGGLACFGGDTLVLDRKLDLPRMPEGFQLHPSGVAIFANVPAGKRSAADGTVVGLKRLNGEPSLGSKTLRSVGQLPDGIGPVERSNFCRREEASSPHHPERP